MRRTLFRVTVSATVAVVAAAVVSAAFGAHVNGRFGPRTSVNGFRAGGFGPGGLMGGGITFGGPGFGGFGLGRPGLMGPGMRGGGSASLLSGDVLTQAANCLNMKLTDLETALKGGKSLSDVAGGGSKATDLINCIVKGETTNLDAAVAAGWLTSDQETALEKQLTNQVTDLVDNGPPVPPSGAQSGGLLQLASNYLGIGVSDLQSDLKSGKTLASLLTGSQTVQQLVTALEAPVQSSLDKAVSAGNITQDQETAILSKLTTRLTNFVNGTKPTTAQMSSLQKSVSKYVTLSFLKHR